MILLTPELRALLRANAEAHHAAQREGRTEPDPVPVVKVFNPAGAATWLATELDADGDTLFGLAGLGFGTPELGSFSLFELESVRLPLGLRIERDLSFQTPFRLSVWTAWSRRAGSILIAEALLNRAAPNPRSSRCIRVSAKTASTSRAGCSPPIPAVDWARRK